jgi:hypothetical protein
MKECLNCQKDISKRRGTAKYCSDNCRVAWNRKNEKSQKGVTPKIDAQEVLGQMKAFLDSIAANSSHNNLEGFKSPENAPNEIEKPKRIAIKRSPAAWVELKRDCADADEYEKWLEDLDNDPYLNSKEKLLIKNT